MSKNNGSMGQMEWMAWALGAFVLTSILISCNDSPERMRHDTERYKQLRQDRHDHEKEQKRLNDAYERYTRPS